MVNRLYIIGELDKCRCYLNTELEPAIKEYCEYYRMHYSEFDDSVRFIDVSMGNCVRVDETLIINALNLLDDKDYSDVSNISKSYKDFTESQLVEACSKFGAIFINKGYSVEGIPDYSNKMIIIYPNDTKSTIRHKMIKFLDTYYTDDSYSKSFVDKYKNKFKW